jgi:hypothetical protein
MTRRLTCRDVIGLRADDLEESLTPETLAMPADRRTRRRPFFVDRHDHATAWDRGGLPDRGE